MASVEDDPERSAPRDEDTGEATTEVLLQIGQVAAQTGLSIPTIRYYEEVGIVVPARSHGGFRLFTEADIDRLMLVKPMKPLAFSLEEISEIVGLLDELALARSNGTSVEVVASLRSYIDELERRSARLHRELEAAAALRHRLEAALPPS